MFEKITNAILFFLIGAFIGGLIIYQFFPKRIFYPEQVLVEKVIKDTLLITKRIKMKAKVDTIYVESGKEYEDYFTGYPEGEKLTIAYSDTTIDNDKLNLSVKYYYEPNLFDIKYKLKQEYQSFVKIDEPSLFIGSGIGFGIGLDGKVQPNIQLGLYYKLLKIK